MPSSVRRAAPAILLLSALVSLPGGAWAQDEPLWCEPNQTPLSGLYPAPTWSQIQAVPDYDKVMTNFRIAQSLRLLVSALEKGLTELGSARSLASAEAFVTGGGSVHLSIDATGYSITLPPGPTACQTDEECALGTVCETAVLGLCDSTSRECVPGCRDGQRGCAGDLLCVDQVCRPAPARISARNPEIACGQEIGTRERDHLLASRRHVRMNRRNAGHCRYLCKKAGPSAQCLQDAGETPAVPGKA